MTVGERACPRCTGFTVYDAKDKAIVCLNCGRYYYLFTPVAIRGKQARTQDHKVL